MPFSIVVGGTATLEFATSAGLDAIRAAMKGRKVPRLREFMNDGLTEDVPALRKELASLLEAKEAAARKARPCFKLMLETIDMAPKDSSSAFMTDGIVYEWSEEDFDDS